MSGYAICTLDDGRTSWRAVATDAGLLPGETFSAAPPPPTMADAAAALIVDVQAWLDSTSGQNGYDSIASCVSYKDSGVAKWVADATAAIAWRDAVWLAAFQWQQAASASPPATFPTSAEVIAQLPQPEAFGWVTHAPGAGAANLVGSN
jgi:hypothetical protein